MSTDGGRALAWLGGVIGASVAYRGARGKAIFPGIPPDAVVYERFVSGNSNRNFLCKFGGAHNCLLVSLTPTELRIQPWFPFNLMFLPEVYGLDHVVRREDIRAVREKKRFFLRTVELEFTDADGEDGSMTLYLRKRAAFLSEIAKSPTRCPVERL